MKQDTFFLNQNYKTLFQTQAWQEAWLESWGSTISSNANLKLSKADGVLYEKFKLKKFIPILNIRPIGSSNYYINSITDEYWRPKNESINDYITDFLASKAQQLFLPKIVEKSITWQALLDSARKHQLYYTKKNLMRAYSVNTSELTFEDYLKKLSSSTRLKIFNRRKRLKEKGHFIFGIWNKSIDEFIKILNTFHLQRWGAPCYEENNLDFIVKFLNKLILEGHEVFLSYISIDAKVVSVLLDIKIERRIYNLQSGYIEDFINGVSLGTLHLGFQIEQAFNNSDIDCYDFMGGNGKNSNYKEKIATQSVTMYDLIFVKPFWLKSLHKINNLMYK